MGRMKDRLLESTGNCDECGAPLDRNDDGELECTNARPCLAQVIAGERRTYSRP